ncbi:hypothetical protein EMCG_09700 [[Emmonsia] crescens]|uniref:BTB domain-containing protein n=1 Tax=[Emmonsia] crescens TaxID=73230 RepID=A0A0G2J9P0_9EURO|nr:hypothetical protein EMCG_09700 [Emmonsia crescens UAMH 3008]
MPENTSLQFPASSYIRRYGESGWTTRPQTFGFMEPSFNVIDESFEEFLVKIKCPNPAADSFTDVSQHNFLAILSGDVKTIDVVVGDEFKRTWSLHETLVCAASSFFQGAMRGQFREGKVYIKDDIHDVFALFVQWLYARSFSAPSMELLLHAYAFGDRFGASGFCTMALDKVYMEALKSEFTAEQVIWVAENTLPNSDLRHLVMDFVALKILSGRLFFSQEEWGTLTPVLTELLKKVAALSRRQPWVNPGMVNVPLLLPKLVYGIFNF